MLALLIFYFISPRYLKIFTRVIAACSLFTFYKRYASTVNTTRLKIKILYITD